ncbi:DUF7507 domain-containing protein [Nitratireductor luteus]|uniref:DUF7507 domain-containing protein n=1 Tax=Nitratireductor luteus TaxID=2976980 RepID=UPI00223F4DD9|nr:hypothetical protein [Nitratireductor luteus]
MHIIASLSAAAGLAPRFFKNTVAGLIAGFLLLTGGNSEARAQTPPDFGSCTSDMYLMQHPSIGAPTTLIQFDSSSNPFIYNTQGSTSFTYNAAGYNPLDNFVYGLTWNGSGVRLLRILPDGSAQDLGNVLGGGINVGVTSPANSAPYQAGEIGPDGAYYVYSPTSNSGTLFRIDLSTRTATAIPLSGGPLGVDLAWHNGLLYSQSHLTGQFYSIDPATGQVTEIGDPQAVMGFGALFGATNGVFGAKNTGGFYRFDLTTGEVTLISDSPNSVGNDGAKCVNTALTFAADTAITKTDNTDTYTAGGRTVYDIVVSNNGPFGVQGALVNDALPAGITEASWTCGTETEGATCTVASGTGAITDVPVNLPAGGSVTFTLTIDVPADFTGDLVNTATVASPADVPDTDTRNNTAIDTDAQAAPAMTIEKTGTLNDLDGDGLLDPGETISYSFLVTNTGNVTLTDVTVNDPLVTVNEDPQTLEPGGSFTFTATYTPTQADIDAGSVTNTATGTGTDPGGNTTESPPDSVTVPPDQTPGLTIEKTGTLNDSDGDGLIDLGETISYSFLVTNTGTVTLSNVTVNDPLVTVDQGPQTLTPGGSFTFTATYAPNQSDIDNGSVTNTARATGTDPGGNTTESPPDSVTVPPDQTPGLTIEKTGTLNDLDGDDLIDPGETISYSFLVTNTGNVTLTDVTVNDPLVTIDQGPQTLAPGASFTFTATYTPTQADIDAGSVENTATATGTTPDGDTPESPPDTVTVPPDQTPGITIEKTGTLNDLNGDGLLDLGETISYSFLVTNTGNVTLTDVMVDDPLVTVDQGPQTLAQGGTFTFTATYTPTQADIDAGSVTNTATGTGTPPSGPEITSPPDTVTVPPEQTSGLSVEKTGSLNDANGNGFADVDEAIDYAFTVTNTGQVTLTNITISDEKAPVSGGPLPSLAPGASDSTTFAARYVVTQADIDAGSVVNVATAQGIDPNGDSVTDTSDDPTDTADVDPDGDGNPDDPTIVELGQDPKLELEKTGTLQDTNGNGFTDAGETIDYTLTVTNTGNVTLPEVTLEDPGPTFAGTPGSGTLSPFAPSLVTLAPGQTQEFTARYSLSQEDIDNAAGAVDAVANAATASSLLANGETITSPEAVSVISLPAAEPTSVVITKQALLRRVRRGEKVPYLIRVENSSTSNVGTVTVTDVMPSGFRYVEGSAAVDGVEVTPAVNGRRIVFEGLQLGPDSTIEISLQLLALSSAGPGEHVNRATVTDPTGRTVSNEARAVVEILAEPVFDCGDIIGKVFDDVNRNGYQDQGEPGLAGVRLATVKGWLVTTDAYGRFHVACADLPDSRIGSNFIMKLDPRTLPTGYRLTTENPRVVRLTAGKMTKLNFGASISRVVRLELTDDAFEAGSTALKPEWDQGIDQLVGVLAEEQSVLRVTYFYADPDRKFAGERVMQMRRLVADRWRRRGGAYRLEVEMRVEAVQ